MLTVGQAIIAAAGVCAAVWARDLYDRFRPK